MKGRARATACGKEAAGRKSAMSAIIRPATEADLPAIVAIANEAVENSAAIWSWTKVTLEDRKVWLAARAARGFPVLVSERDGSVAGYASYGDFRAFDGYLHTVEHSIYMATDARGQGLGAPLLAALIDHARGAGKHVMVAGIALPNPASIALHAGAGFVEVGRMPQVGFKFGAFQDLLLMQKML